MDRKILKVSDLVLPEWRGRLGEIFEMINEIDIETMNPITVDLNNFILDGRKRYLACIYRGVEMIPVVVRTSTGKIYTDRNAA